MKVFTIMLMIRQVHNRHGTNGFINKNIKSKAYDHTVKTYEHVTKQPGKISAMSRLREMTLNGEVPSHPLSPSTVPSTCQPKLVDDYRMHLDSPLGEDMYCFAWKLHVSYWNYIHNDYYHDDIVLFA